MQKSLQSRVGISSSTLCGRAALVARPEARSICSRASPALDVPSPSPEAAVPYVLPETKASQNRQLVERLRGELILAPLTKGGNVPYRKLVTGFGAKVTVSEMIFARMLVRKGDKVEAARLRKGEDEHCFGVQIATKVADEALEAAKLAAASGASFLDLNCGCPIYEASRRGLGAVQLRKPGKLGKLVERITAEAELPLTVKIRTGPTEDNINVQRVVENVFQAGAAAVTIHGRTMEQRYRKAADWQLLQQVAGGSPAPIIGNGDILTQYEARRHLRESGCCAVMVGRGALIKPWIFEEWRRGVDLQPSPEERIAIYRQLVVHMKQHFGDDERGKRKAFYFLPWHFSFFCRYRPLPEEVYGEQSRSEPLLGVRRDTHSPELGEQLDELPLLERLLRCQHEPAHEAVADRLWESSSDGNAVQRLADLASADLMGWEHVAKNGRPDGDWAAQG